MSGIVGILNLNGAPVDRDLLRRMTDFMTYRGPDAQQIWVHGNVGFGHAMLSTVDDAYDDRQPCTLDGEVWITADARIDGRADLIRELSSKGRSSLAAASDVHLILHAYHAWGEECVHHLLGDFSFGIWDGNRQRLFCARDHMGVKPFYYAHLNGSFIFSNTLDCVRLYPAVSEAFNDMAIADFLLFSVNRNPATTTFANVQRVPAAHCLTWSDSKLNVRRYWELSIPPEVRYRRPTDYVEHFREHMWAAVADRLRTQRVAVRMSGGLDSSSVAAVAREVLSKDGEPFDLRAHTLVFDRLIPDEERHYASLVAQALNIPIHILASDDYGLYDRYDQPELYRPEPLHGELGALHVDDSIQMAAYSRVVLTGWDGDSVLRENPSYHFRALARKRRFARLLLDLGRYVRSERDVPRIGIRTGLKRRLRFVPKPPVTTFPVWINPDFAERLNLRARWNEIKRDVPDSPVRPYAFRALTSPVWSYFFEICDPGASLFPLEFRYPFMDLRLINYLLSIPAVPWCTNKKLLREAMRGILPEVVRCRPKTPAAGHPMVENMRSGRYAWVDQFEPEPELAKYVERNSIPKLVGEEDATKLAVNSRPFSLNRWLQNSKRNGVHGGKCNDRFKYQLC